MKLNTQISKTEISGAQSIGKFGMEMNAKAYQILTDGIYSNKIKAIIRELSTNAWDSHVEANNHNPFDVHLPFTGEEYFYIRDYGTGLSEQSILNVYTSFFTSTKDTSNKYNGILGIGSKVPYSYNTKTFTIDSYYHGTQYTYVCFIDDAGIPSYAKVSEVKTVANEAADTLCYITFVTDTTGNLQQKTNAALTFNAATASLGCTTFVGAFTGTASGNLPLTGGTLSGSVRHTETVNNISANAATITLNSGNHQTLDLTSATGDVTITVTVPTGSSSGTIIVKQDNPVRDILWTGATIKWMGVEPQWNLDPVSSIRIISWRYDGTTVYMSATEIAI